MKKTSDVWSECLGVKILDPDGWDRENFQYSFYEEYITEGEFMERADRSTTDYSYYNCPEKESFVDADSTIVGYGVPDGITFSMPEKYVLDIDKVKTLDDVIAVLDGLLIRLFGDNLDEKTMAIIDKYFKKG